MNRLLASPRGTWAAALFLLAACAPSPSTPPAASAPPPAAAAESTASAAAPAAPAAPTAPAAPPPLTQVRMGTQTSVNDIAMWLGEERGYFKQEGIDLELIPFSNASEMV